MCAMFVWYAEPRSAGCYGIPAVRVEAMRVLGLLFANYPVCVRLRHCFQFAAIFLKSVVHVVVLDTAGKSS